jgi:hypothetical protein
VSIFFSFVVSLFSLEVVEDWGGEVISELFSSDNVFSSEFSSEFSVFCLLAGCSASSQQINVTELNGDEWNDEFQNSPSRDLDSVFSELVSAFLA